jgi:hypothetical protein
MHHDSHGCEVVKALRGRRRDLTTVYSRHGRQRRIRHVVNHRIRLSKGIEIYGLCLKYLPNGL